MTSAHAPEDVRIFHKECVSLAKADYEVYLVECGESYEKEGVHMIGVGELPTSRLKRMTEGAKKVYETARALDCDIYHFHDPELIPYGLKLKKLGKKVVFDIHEQIADSIMEKEYLPKAVRSSVRSVYSSYEARKCRRFDALITVTPTQTAFYEAINPNTVEVTNYPILEEQSEPVATPRERALFFAGGIDRQWNHHVILKALESFSDCKYVLCGSENAYLDSLKAMPAWNQVVYLGKIPHAKVIEAMEKCMIGISLLTPGRNTAWNTGTMGNTKIFEQMAAGLPVVCTNFDLWRAFIEQYHCGICVDPTDEEQVSSAIRQLLEHPEKAREMGQNGRKAVETEFNWEIPKKKLLDLYSNL